MLEYMGDGLLWIPLGIITFVLREPPVCCPSVSTARLPACRHHRAGHSRPWPSPPLPDFCDLRSPQ
jgi:hypothetical protein